VADQAKIELTFKPESSYRSFELGFLQGSNPRAYNRIMTIASVNAARTFVKPMRAEAPRRTGRLAGSVTAKSGRYDRPSGNVGPRPGKSRADQRGAWYRYFVTAGHGTRKSAALGRASAVPWSDIAKGVPAPTNVGTGKIAGNHFVARVSQNAGNLQKALDAYYATIERFLNDEVFRHKMTRFRKGKR